MKNFPRQVKDEPLTEMFNEIPQPVEGLHETGPPPFLNKTYEIVDDPNTDPIISWSKGFNSFVVWDVQALSISLLPNYFKHNNFSSFVRQLNTYGFRKIDPDRWEFANEDFIKGQRHLLKNIRRRKAPNSPQSPHEVFDSCVEVGRFGLDGEVDQLRRDRQVLMAELVGLRQQQQDTRAYLQALEQRLEGTERKQRQMMTFLAKAMRNPTFLQQLVQHNNIRQELEEVLNKKRRRPIEQGFSTNIEFGELCQNEEERMNFSESEPHDFDVIPEFEASELEKIAMDIHGSSGSIANQQEVERFEQNSGGGRALDDRFWEDLLNEKLKQDMESLVVGEENVEDETTLFEGPS
ncbi:Heat shock factor (HSF)-type, DNA-binding [Dillenia turbinata]|uniref:Heat shock factor (HSF)-type, DNA-binding n=1 Tax=Dillenia turbinata TaxID=194707 RepID=A0AAN8ULG7_9MAGN